MKTRAAVLWDAPGKWTVQELELDEPGPTEVLVEMAATGLCHSDDHFVTGDIQIGMTPMVGGHEGAGIVRRVGSEVHDLQEGDHIVTSFIPGCGKCRWCAVGMQNLCDYGAIILEGVQPSGGFRMHADDGTDVGTASTLGTFSQWQVYDQVSVVKIDPEIPLDVACLVACGVATGFGSATNAAQVRPADVVMVIGAGGIGMNAVQGAASAGAAHVVVVDPAPTKKELAPHFGATEVFADFDEADAFVKSITNGQGADSAILCIGVVGGDDIGRAYGAIRKGGTVVVTGIGKDTDDGIPGVNAFTLAMYQKRIQGALYGMASPREAMPMLLRLYQAGRLKLDELITKRYTLDEINEAYADMRAGTNIRGIIEFDRS